MNLLTSKTKVMRLKNKSSPILNGGTQSYKNDAGIMPTTFLSRKGKLFSQYFSLHARIKSFNLFQYPSIPTEAK